MSAAHTGMSSKSGTLSTTSQQAAHPPLARSQQQQQQQQWQTSPVNGSSLQQAAAREGQNQMLPQSYSSLARRMARQLWSAGQASSASPDPRSVHIYDMCVLAVHCQTGMRILWQAPSHKHQLGLQPQQLTTTVATPASVVLALCATVEPHT